jgi:hypothetical protein
VSIRPRSLELGALDFWALPALVTACATLLRISQHICVFRSVLRTQRRRAGMRRLRWTRWLLTTLHVRLLAAAAVQVRESRALGTGDRSVPPESPRKVTWRNVTW